MQYQLGKLYYSNGNYYEAYQAFGASADIQEADRYYFPVMLVQLGNTLKRLGQSRAALELLEPFLPVYPTYADLPFLLGTLCMDTGDLEGIEYFFKTALEIGETSTYTTVVGTGTYRAAHNLAVFYEVTGNMKLAQHYYSFAAGFGFEPSAERMKILNLI
jgi:tetratricopeptide (TPR) repeat protein